MAGLTDFKGRNLLAKPIPPGSADNPEKAGSILAFMLVDQTGQPVDLSSPGGGTVADHKNFIYEQATPSDTWTIIHNLGRYPSVTIVDSAGTQGEGDVDYHTDDPARSGNTVTVSFSSAFSGRAFLN